MYEIDYYTVRKYWAILTDPFPETYNDISVYINVRLGSESTSNVEVLGTYMNIQEARQCYDLAVPQVTTKYIWSGNHRKVRAELLVLDKDVYADPTHIHHIESLEWHSVPSPLPF